MRQPVGGPSDAFLQFVLSRARVSTHVCTYQKLDGGYTLLLRTVPDYNFIFIRRGKVVWVVDDQEWPLEPGSLIVVPPGIKHYAFSRTKRVTIGSIHVTMALPGGQDAFELLVPARLRQVPANSRLDRYLEMWTDEWSRTDEQARRLTLAPWSRLITLELFREDAAAGRLEQRPLDPLVAEVLDELARRVGEPTTLDDLAALSGYTSQHLNRTFRRVLGVTPLQHLARLRMERAAAMLEEGALTVKAIASAVACDDPYYFSRVFRQHFGRSPQQYREAAGSNSPS